MWPVLEQVLKVYARFPPKLYCPRVNPKVQLSLEAFNKYFRWPGRPVIIPFSSLASLGFGTRAVPMSELKSLYPLSEDAPPIAFVANGMSLNFSSAQFAQAIDSLSKDLPVSREQNLRNYPRNMLVPDTALKHLGVDAPPFLRRGDMKPATLWFGPTAANANTEMHSDPGDNWACMITGAKQFSILAPTEYYALRPRCQSADLDGLCYAREDSNNKITVTVNEGEMLYLPAGWFHAVHNIRPSVMVNYWSVSVAEQVGMLRGVSGLAHFAN